MREARGWGGAGIGAGAEAWVGVKLLLARRMRLTEAKREAVGVLRPEPVFGVVALPPPKAEAKNPPREVGVRGAGDAASPRLPPPLRPCRLLLLDDRLRARLMVAAVGREGWVGRA